MKKNILVSLLFVTLVLPFSAFGITMEDFKMDAKAGEVIYGKNCVRCHGKTGAGDGPDAAGLRVKPRNFTTGIFKFKSTPFTEKWPKNRDLYQTVSDGLPGSAMPAWKRSLSIQDRVNVVAFIKTIAGMTGEAKEATNLDGWVPPTAKNLKAGKKLFLSRCAQCHGDEGRGNTTMPLLDDWGERIWPRNFTKPKLFRIGNSPMEIFYRISAGIPGTPMPSFNDPEIGDDQLNNEQKWLVANYVNSLEEKSRIYRKRHGKRVDAWYTEDLPEDIDDMDPWKFARPMTLALISVTEPGRKNLIALNDSITVRALNNEKEIGLLLEWDDPSESMAGDEDSSEIIQDEEVFDDAVALYMPKGVAEVTPTKPFFGYGDEKTPVNAWYVTGTATQKKFTFTGKENFESPEETDSSVKMEATYNAGQWRVYLRRPLQKTVDNDPTLEAGKATPFALSIWDGSNNEYGLTHTFTDWYWLNILAKGKGGVF